jgi:hypothetical protein
MPAEATLLDNDLQPRLQSLQARLAQDPIVATLPPLTQVAGSRFIVAWNDTAISVTTSVIPSDRWDFGFTVPEAAWKEFTRTDPGPLNNTAQASATRVRRTK